MSKTNSICVNRCLDTLNLLDRKHVLFSQDLDVLVHLAVLVITVQSGGVTTCKLVRIIALFLLYLPIPTRSGNEGFRS